MATQQPPTSPSLQRQKQTIGVFEVASKTGRHFVRRALANGHRVTLLQLDNAGGWKGSSSASAKKDGASASEFAAHKAFAAIAGLSLDVDVVVVSGAEDHLAASKAVAALVAAIKADEKSQARLKHVFLVSAAGAKFDAGFFARNLFADLAQAEKSLHDLAAEKQIKFTIFRPPTLIDTDKSNDVFVFDEAAQKNLQGLSNQVSFTALADAILEIVETQPRFVNKVAAVNSKTILDKSVSSSSDIRKAVYRATAKASPYILISLAILAVGIVVAKRRS
ncbi:hypothetical protein HK100_000619 [Physocladia obscura]|uniref:NAD(P)-binding domain-containing protein n=1 Tax=Physocladia obscura TaxID=109957 RepID=A0AAD5XGT8_9FUNG|nr:hypothetical protein HK100_000619 [Physocladia obscura]